MRRSVGVFRARIVLMCLVVFTAAGGCASNGVNKGDFNLVGLEEEWKLGQQIEQDLAKQLPLVADAATVGYVNEIGRAVVAQTELASLPWEFHVVADKAINAFNTPGGHVYVNAGLITASKNVSELAGVIAHEVAHGVARHGTERLTKAHGLNVVAGLLLGENPAIYQQILAQIAGQGAIARFSRSDELEADRLGVRYMYAAGYDPEGMVGLFETLLGERKRRPSAVEGFFSTHPLTESRINAVRAEIRSLPNRGSLVARDGRLASIQQRVSRY